MFALSASDHHLSCLKLSFHFDRPGRLLYPVDQVPYCRKYSVRRGPWLFFFSAKHEPQFVPGVIRLFRFLKVYQSDFCFFPVCNCKRGCA